MPAPHLPTTENDARHWLSEPPRSSSQCEQDNLLHAIEASLPVSGARDLSLWTQGPLHALLPHRVMLCLRLDAHNQLQQLECLHGAVLDAGVHGRLSGRDDDGLAMRLARHWRSQEPMLPLVLDADAVTRDGPGRAGKSPAALRHELRELGLGNVLLHGSGPLPGGATFFALFGLPQGPHVRHAYLLQLLLPYLHLALQRVGQRQTRAGMAALARPASTREVEILHWVREGKSNDEIGQILGISGLTVKNHLQRLYRLLGVSNRAHAIARGMALQLFERPPLPLARAA
ncbi:MAG TPA: LuxR C-terminal-related transcriptional regulator [Duganella sp.]|jgi:transcriptional regulator EpsA